MIPLLFQFWARHRKWALDPCSELEPPVLHLPRLDQQRETKLPGVDLGRLRVAKSPGHEDPRPVHDTGRGVETRNSTLLGFGFIARRRSREGSRPRPKPHFVARQPHQRRARRAVRC